VGLWRQVVELYGICDGDFAEPPEVQESIAAETILDPTFRFKERGFYKVSFESVNELKRSAYPLFRYPLFFAW